MLFLTKQGIDMFNERAKTPDSFLLRSSITRDGMVWYGISMVRVTRQSTEQLQEPHFPCFFKAESKG